MTVDLGDPSHCKEQYWEGEGQILHRGWKVVDMRAASYDRVIYQKALYLTLISSAEDGACVIVSKPREMHEDPMKTKFGS